MRAVRERGLGRALPVRVVLRVGFRHALRNLAGVHPDHDDRAHRAEGQRFARVRRNALDLDAPVALKVRGERGRIPVRGGQKHRGGEGLGVRFFRGALCNLGGLSGVGLVGHGQTFLSQNG